MGQRPGGFSFGFVWGALHVFVGCVALLAKRAMVPLEDPSLSIIVVISFILVAYIDISTTNNTVASVTLKLFTCLRIAINSQVPSLLLDL